MFTVGQKQTNKQDVVVVGGGGGSGGSGGGGTNDVGHVLKHLDQQTSTCVLNVV